MLAREIALGIGFTEGPVWIGGGRLAVTSMSRGLVTILALDGGVVESIETGGGPNGLALDQEGRIHVVQNATFRTRSTRPVHAGIQVIDNAVVRDVPVPDSVAPNDCAFGPDGALWYTDPGSDADRGLGPRIRRWEPQSGRVTTVAADLPFPNGLAFTVDGGTLLVADSHEHRLVSYPVLTDRLGEPSTFAELPDSEPDGIALDRAGAVYVASFALGEVIVVGKEGDVVERIDLGTDSHPTNVCFAGDDLQTLVVTLASGGRVVAIDDRFEGLPL